MWGKKLEKQKYMYVTGVLCIKIYTQKLLGFDYIMNTLTFLCLI